jgi:hypothetical protein
MFDFDCQAERDRYKILRIEQWGAIAWVSMQGAFCGCENLQVMAEDVPDLSKTTDVRRMFASTNVQGGVGQRDMSTITQM